MRLNLKKKFCAKKIINICPQNQRSGSQPTDEIHCIVTVRFTRAGSGFALSPPYSNSSYPLALHWTFRLYPRLFRRIRLRRHSARQASAAASTENSSSLFLDFFQPFFKIHFHFNIVYHRSATTVCRLTSNPCEKPAYCTGVSADCPETPKKVFSFSRCFFNSSLQQK